MVRLLALLAPTLVFGMRASPAQAGDAAAGGRYFHSVCATCHGSTVNSPPGVGPRLFGVIGRHSGTLPGYHYSPAMQRAGITWTPDQLRHYLANPQAVVRGNKMPFAGISRPQDIDNVISYLQTLH